MDDLHISEMIDIGDLPMEDLDSLPDTALTAVLKELRTPTAENTAAFSSALT